MLFQLQNVTKTYGAVTALDNLSVTVPKGAVGLLGPNGSGKTTMIRTLLGLITIDKGSGSLLDLDIRRQQLDVRRVVGFSPEDECLFPRVVGIEFVGYAGELVGMRSRTRCSGPTRCSTMSASARPATAASSPTPPA